MSRLEIAILETVVSRFRNRILCSEASNCRVAFNLSDSRNIELSTL